MLILFIYSCQSDISWDPDVEKEKILKLRDMQRTSHFEKNAESFVSRFSPEFISVNRGKVSRTDSAESVQIFQEYFDAVEFVKWDDLAEPEIRFSTDGSIAYVVTSKIVELTYPADEGGYYEDKTEYAWMSVYKKMGGEWYIDAIASTNVEPVNKLIKED